MENDFSLDQHSFDGQEWPNRYKVIKNFLKSGTSILELGSGYGKLQKYLGFEVPRYVKVDKFEFEDTIIADLNSTEYPEFEERFDYVICSGLLEYLFNPKYLLHKAKEYSDKAIISYYFSKNKLQYGMNHFTIGAFEKLLTESGWKILDKKKTAGINQFVYLLN